MTSHRARATKVVVYLLLIASAATAVAAVVVSAGRLSANRDASPQKIPFAVESVNDEPIASEADVFRTKPADLAIDPTPDARRAAHPRTLATYRALRAYPGAPPRIPHGLTPAEALRGGCKTCHERGGYSQRFGAYVPLTPHPEMGACLQCHVGDARLLPTPLPGMDPNARCRQCHSAGGMVWRDSATSFKALPWPQLTRVSGEHAPPPIPHGLELRGNCLACHSAPAGVKEIRTSHPERANCRQCHVETNDDVDEFVRPQHLSVARNKGAP
jgi:cytochrome c-type protein NapB